ncbi:putative oxidase, partial [Pseudomonas putida S11]
QVGLRAGDWVYSVLCEKGDQLVLPAGTRRWVELGEYTVLPGIAVVRQRGRGCSRGLPGM